MRKYIVGSHTIFYVNNLSDVPSEERPKNYIINILKDGIVTGGSCGSDACYNCPLAARYSNIDTCDTRARLFLLSQKIIRTKELL